MGSARDGNDGRDREAKRHNAEKETQDKTSRVARQEKAKADAPEDEGNVCESAAPFFHFVSFDPMKVAQFKAIRQ